MRKKALSLFLAACMVISLIPTTFAAIGTTYEYKFNPNGAEGDVNNGPYVRNFDEFVETNDMWKWETSSATNQKGPYKAFMHEWGGIDTNTTAAGQWLALKIKVKEAGVFSASLLYGISDSKGGYGHIYLLPGDTEDIASELKIERQLGGEIAYYDTTKNEKASAELSKNLTLEEKEYILVFCASAIGKEGGGYRMYPNTLTLKKIADAPATENEPLVDEFIKEEDITPATDYQAATVTGLELNGNAIEAEKNEDGTYNLTAPKKEEKFLYWAMGLVGNKRIVSFLETLENYVPEGNYRNYLVPVYEGDVDASKKEFYNQNGQLIPDANESTEVSMPGYGSTSSWKQYGDTNIYVADYGKTVEQRDEVTVTVVGGNGGGKVLFGTEVTCTANDKDADENPFKCWKMSDINGKTEIVSVDKEYKFKAWETCTVTAVYEEHTSIAGAMKIIIDDFAVGSEKGIMAEFIGFGNDVVEKGIMFTATGETEATKIAMTTKDNQFTVIADENGTYEGYAIVGNATDGYKLITDGSYTK